MCERKSTGGEWRIVPRPFPHSTIENGAQIWSGNTHIASVSNRADKPLDQKVADARLIAAAPEMLEALQLCQKTLAILTTTKDAEASGLNIISAYAQCVEAEARARAAITKATVSQ